MSVEADASAVAGMTISVVGAVFSVGVIVWIVRSCQTNAQLLEAL